MVRVARERISDLFALAETEAKRGDGTLPNRYVALARRIGMRYNVRLPPEFGALYCRGCSTFWIEGRTVRTRLRGGHQVRTCLRCGRARRLPLGPRATPRETGDIGMRRPAMERETALVEEEAADTADSDEGEEE